MSRRWCAPWCAATPVRYGLCCARHWATLTEYERCIIRDSYRRTHGGWAHGRQVVLETIGEGARARAEAFRG